MDQSTGKRATLKDVAQRCNVSLTTVSRVLSNSGYPVSKTVKESILLAATELGYGSAGSARFFMPEPPKEIAAIIPTITNPFYTSLVSGFESVVTREGYGVVIYGGASDADIINSVAAKRFRGILVSSANMYEKFVKAASDGRFGDARIVFADCPFPQNSYNSVCFDYKKGTFIGTSYLIENGHTEIVYAGMKLDRESRNLRLDGFRDAITAGGLTYSDGMVEILDDGGDSDSFQLDVGERLAERILARNKNVTAIVAVNDMVAFGVLRYLKRCGISVPGDISVLGYDDNIFCGASNPPLTTIKVQDEQIGRMAAKLLLDDMTGAAGSAGADSISLYLEPCLIRRESVACLRR